LNKIAIVFILPLCLTALAGCARASTSQADNQQMAAEPHIIQSNIPGDLDTSLSKASENGLFIVTVSSQLDPVLINEIHTWLVTVATPQGEPVEEANLTLEHLMPQHGHGMPTEPGFTGYLGDGQYQLEGMKFNMPGWWMLDFTIQTPTQVDTVTFNLVLDS
jgi:hypothetical protein